MPKFIVDITLDGYDTEEEHLTECLNFIKEQLDIPASHVTMLEEPTVGRRVPFGYKCVGGVDWTEDKEQQDALNYMRNLRGKGMSYRRISLAIKEHLDIDLSHSGVRNILNRNPEPKSRMIF